MNYYIQGNAANADKIKAAFEKLNTHSINGYDFSRGDVLFFSFTGKEGVKYMMSTNIDSWLADMITTHPDYKELELPVDSKFNVGDWVVFNNSHNSIYQISEIRDSYYTLTHTHGGSMPISFSQENLIRPWTIEDANDGDILATTKVRSCPFIYRKTSYNNRLAYYYAGIDGNGNFCEGCLKRTLFHFGSVENVVPATNEQRDLLFAKMKEAGYEWDAGKKELRKIKHYDIANFHAGMPVLVRWYNTGKWRYSLYSFYEEDTISLFDTVKGSFNQCIPFNEDTKHLLGTTNMCPEEYINW